MFKGYWKRPEETAKCFDIDGFFKTGDVGREDEHGNIYITDRIKELIKYKGFQVAPAELEGILNTNPLVTDAAVIGVWKEEIASEVPMAYLVVLKEMRPKSQAEAKKLASGIAQWLAGKVAPHKKLRGGIVFLDTIPKSPSGKILRRVLRDRIQMQGKKVQAKL